jgi:hypothetical protein
VNNHRKFNRQDAKTPSKAKSNIFVFGFFDVSEMGTIGVGFCFLVKETFLASWRLGGEHSGFRS